VKIFTTPALANSVSYLSFVTLTSTGYGDLVPVHPIARSLCNIESIIGQLYPATLLARLVTLELSATAVSRDNLPLCPLVALADIPNDGMLPRGALIHVSPREYQEHYCRHDEKR
jgi:hypothetical protein